LGVAFEYVEQIEEYGTNAEPVANLGLWFTTDTETDQGAAKLLLETQNVFRIAHRGNLDSFKTLLLPSYSCLEPADIEAIEAFVDNGGAVIALAQGAMDKDQTQFVLDVGAEYVGPHRYDCDYTAASAELDENLISSPVLNYVPAMRVEPSADAEVLAAVYEPYFSRTYEHYTSHKNTPQQLEPAEHPALIQSGKVIFAAHPLDRMYKMRAAPPHRDFFEAALDRVHTAPNLRAEMPSAGRVNLLHQPEDSRYVAHLLYTVPQYRGGLELIEDVVPIQNVPVELRVPEAVTSARLVPSDEALEISREDDVCRVVVPEFEMHCAVVFEYDAD
ncbi:MAG: hypothetical protein AAF266_04105, partial [Planctomycetota bacterium]